MMLKTLTGASNLAKATEKDNRYKARGWRLGLLSSLSMAALTAQAIPASIAWQIPLRADERYELELAKDPGFNQMILTTEVRGTGYTTDVVDEGVYHWRLMRPAQGLAGIDRSTFVSGSFAALAPAADRTLAARLSWPATPGADRYKLYLTDGRLALRTVQTAAPFFVIDGPSEPMTIEVVPYTGGRPTDRAYHYVPGLALDTGRPPAPVPVPPPPAAIAAPVVVVPAPAAVATVAPAVTPVKPAEALPLPTAAPAERRRIYLLAVEGYVTDEDITMSKLEVKLNARGRYAGGGATLFTQPAAGLIVTAGGGYHEHRQMLRREDLFPGRAVSVAAARYTLELSIGWDLLYGLDIPQHLLGLSVLSASTQLPLLPLIFDSTDAVPPRLQKRQDSLLGGAASYGFFGAYAGLLLEGGYAVEQTDDAALMFGRGSLEFYPSDGLVLLLGAYQRSTQATRCHSDKGICLREGKVKTEILETAGFAGFGMALH